MESLVKRTRISIAKLMAIVAMIAVGLVVVRPQLRQPSRSGGLSPAEAYVSLGMAALAVEHWAEARSLFGTALKRDPNCSDAYVGLGQTAYLQGQFREAHRFWSRAIDVAGSTPGVGDKLPALYRMRATASVALSRFDEPAAAKHCRAALDDLAKGSANASTPSFMMFPAELAAGEVELRMGALAERQRGDGDARKHYAKAAVHARKALTIQPKSAGAAGLLEEILQRQAEP
jgi:tetratricopeptide (TPR) repeat protein